nr:ribosomal protein S18 [Thismia huangii]
MKNIKKKKIMQKYKYILLILFNKINYKNINLIIELISERGKIFSKCINRLIFKQQQFITFVIKQARFLCLLPL